MADCNGCLYNPVCELWRAAECQDACSALTGDLYPCPLYEPAADVSEVRHGEWVHTDKAFSWRSKDECSECGYHQKDRINLDFYKYCPNCGAKMDGKGEGDG